MWADGGYAGKLVAWAKKHKALTVQIVAVTGSRCKQAAANAAMVKACGWQWRYTRGDEVLLPAAADIFDRPVDAETASLRVRPSPRVLAIFRFMSGTVIRSLPDICGNRWPTALNRIFEYHRRGDGRGLAGEEVPVRRFSLMRVDYRSAGGAVGADLPV